MSRIIRKPNFCLCENKGADQLRSNCFRYIAEHQGKHSTNNNWWHRQRMPCERLECRGTAFILNMLKTKAVAHSIKSTVCIPWKGSKVYINMKELCGCRKRSYCKRCLHGDGMAFIAISLRLYHALKVQDLRCYMECYLSYCTPVEFARHCHGVDCICVEHSLGPMASYDKSTKRDEKELCKF